MLWFKKKSTLKASDIFNGFVDWHSHILPGVDDGIKTMDDAIAVLEEYEKLGFKKIWLTPHVMEDFPNETEFLLERFGELKDLWKGNVEISLASENMLDNIFEERLENNKLLPIGENKDYLLVETSYYTPPYAMDEMLENARKKGYNLILAHPERYRYMEETDYKKLKNQGILFQMNILSIMGAYGETARKKAEWLLNKRMIDFLGTDIHRLESTMGYIKEVPLKSDMIEKLRDIIVSTKNI